MAHALSCAAATAGIGIHHDSTASCFNHKVAALPNGLHGEVRQHHNKGHRSQAIRCVMASGKEHGAISTATASSGDEKQGGLRGKLNKVVLAYSGGLDTSVIVPWLRENYGCEVICFTADVGQGAIEMEGLEKKAKASGASQLVVKDLKEEFASEYIYPCLRAGAVYERKYLLGTSMARPVIAKAMVDVAKEVGADAVAHGCTGKGNDQVRFELTFYALNPELKVVAPWREWDITGREDAIEYANKHNVPVPVSKKSIYSRDRNLWHLSHEGDLLEDPVNEPKEDMYMMSVAPENAPSKPEYLRSSPSRRTRGRRAAMAPGLYSDIGKKTRDLLYKDYNTHQKFTLTTYTPEGVAITAAGTRKNESIFGELHTQLKNKNLTVDVKANTESDLLTTVTVDEFGTPGLKSILSLVVPDQRSGKLELQYLHEYAGVNASVGLNSNPMVNLSGVFGSKELSVGVDVSFDTATSNFTKYNAALSLTNSDLIASLHLNNHGDTLTASYYHLIKQHSSTAVGAELSHSFSRNESTLIFGSQHSLDPHTTVKARFNNYGMASALAQHEWRPKSFLTISGEVDTKAIEKSTKVGLSLVLKH